MDLVKIAEYLVSGMILGLILRQIKMRRWL